MTDGRPLLHFTARDGWINDPLALTWHGGRYHLFFQHVPGSGDWAPECRWGHAVSDDLVRWRELPIALEPGDGDDGVWSGTLAVDDAGAATILYTSVTQPHLGAGRVRTARPLDDDWIRWAKGPVVAEAPDGDGTEMFRDPFVFRDGDGWRMLVGYAQPDGTGAALAYTSPDLAEWTPTGVAAERVPDADGVWTGPGWECPQLIRADGADLLVFSAWEPAAIHHVVAAVGDWRDGRFIARAWQQLTFGTEYAGSVFRDREGRPCAIFWIRGAAGDGWAGALTVPQLITVQDDRIVLVPHPDAVAAAAEAGLPVRSAGEELPDGLALAPDGHELVLSADGRELGRVPSASGEARLLADGPVVEVWTDRGALAVPRPRTSASS